MAAELVETTKLYARTCGGVQPQWIERAAMHLVERSYSEPRWDAKTGGAIATEKVTLYGLVLIPARVVPYGPINPKIAREIFIHHGLVLRELRTDGAFFRFNEALVREVELLEAKIRQRNLLADVATRFAFYEARVPAGVTNTVQFETWRRGAERENPRLLFMSKEDLLRADAPPITPENYPDKLSESGGGLKLPVTYRFEPGEVADGLTVAVPVAALSQLRPERYEWMVPGMLAEKIAALLKGLPGGLRRNFVPVPEWAKAAAEGLREKSEVSSEKSEGEEAVSLRDALAGWLSRKTGVEVNGGDFGAEGLPEYLRMNFRVMDDAGKVLGTGRDLGLLQRKLAREAVGSFAGIYQREFHRDGILKWDFGDLPESVTVQRFGMTIVAFPAVVDLRADWPAEHWQCGIRLLPSREAAEEGHRGGVRRLFWMEYRRDIKGLTGKLPDFGKMKLQYLLLGRSEELRVDLLTLIVDRALFGDGAAPRKQAEFEVLKREAALRLYETAEKVGALVGAILEEHLKLALLVEAEGKRFGSAGVDVHDQLLFLLVKHFLVKTPFRWLEYFPRYVAGMRARLEKLRQGGSGIVDRDREGMERVRPWWNRYLERKRQHDAVALVDGELELFRWMMEEWRVAVFAQELGTAVPVSERRMERQWERVRRVT